MRRGKNIPPVAPAAVVGFSRRRTAWPKNLNRAGQLAAPGGALYIGGRIGELAAGQAIEPPSASHF
jgi:hypothetical protein